MKTVTKSEFKPRSFEYFRLVEGGETLVITNHGRPVAKIVPYQGQSATGVLTGVIKSYQDPTEPVSEEEWEDL